MPRTLRSSLISLSQLPCPHNLPRILLCTSRIFELASSPYWSRGFLTSGINLPCLFRTKEELPSLCTLLYLYPKHIYVCLNAHRRVKDGSPTRSDRPPTPPACEHFPAADRNVSLTQICSESSLGLLRLPHSTSLSHSFSLQKKKIFFQKLLTVKI